MPVLRKDGDDFAARPFLRPRCQSPTHVGPSAPAAYTSPTGLRLCVECGAEADRAARASQPTSVAVSSLPPVASYADCSVCRNDRVLFVPGSNPARFAVCDHCIPRHCPRCQGNRFYIVERGGYEYSTPCPCRSMRSHEVAAFLTEAQFPGEFGPLLLGPLPVLAGRSDSQRDMHELSLAWGRAWTPGCVDAPGFHGPPGTGKTLAQCRAAAHAVLCGKVVIHTPKGPRELPPRARFLAWPQWVQDAQDSISDPEVKKESIRRFMDYQVLIVDELFYRDGGGALRPSAYKRELLASFLHAAQDKGISLLVATNCSESELRAALPDSAFSRLASSVTFFPVDGPDVRQLRKQQREPLL